MDSISFVSLTETIPEVKVLARKRVHEHTREGPPIRRRLAVTRHAC